MTFITGALVGRILARSWDCEGAMKLSELIKELQEIQDKEGDGDAYFLDIEHLKNFWVDHVYKNNATFFPHCIHGIPIEPVNPIGLTFIPS